MYLLTYFIALNELQAQIIWLYEYNFKLLQVENHKTITTHYMS